MHTTLIWATDGSVGADLALEEPLRLAGLTGARVVAVRADRRLNGRAGGRPVLADEEDLSEPGADLIVCGTRGLGALSGLRGSFRQDGADT
jgi:nucleotide-binding universal stress UspA family protein